MKNYDELLQHLINEALQEDIGDGDHSTLSCIPKIEIGKAVLKVKQNGVLAGVAVAEKVFKQVEPGCHFNLLQSDGHMVAVGQEAFIIEASVHTILKCERLVLNIMQRMSGIATLTRLYTDIIKGYNTNILDTRKTTPNFRLLEKEAVRIGGGTNHRFALYDMIMLKDNHIDFAGGIENAINKAHAYVQGNHLNLKIEIETRSLEDVQKVLIVGEGKVFRIMLDNFQPEQVAHAVKLINRKFETEASGGISLHNLEDYAQTGVDYISIGALIHQARSLDLSLKAMV